MGRQVTCPVCGNVTSARATENQQKCKWCRRPFVIRFIRHKGKYIWEVNPVATRRRSVNRGYCGQVRR